MPDGIFDAACRGDGQALVRLLEITQPDFELRLDKIAAATGATRQAVEARLRRAWTMMRENISGPENFAQACPRGGLPGASWSGGADDAG